MELATLLHTIETTPEWRIYGKVVGVLGLLIEVSGISSWASIGSYCTLHSRGHTSILGEVIGFRHNHTLVMPYGSTEGIGLGCRVEIMEMPPVIYPHNLWLGRVINGLGEPIDGGTTLARGDKAFFIRKLPPPAHTRSRVGERIDVGIKAINSFVTCCKGQRMGIFAGSGVGKSILLSMLARFTASDVIVIGLIGERGREVQEFIQDNLGPEGLARSVLVIATSDESPLMRRQAAHMTLAVSEFFAAQGKEVLCLMDSVTRFAMAQREIGLSAGEPPASKGYTPTVFAELPKLLERAGPSAGGGNITGIFTVLVEGDDHNEPIADAVRGILDGHIVLERRIAEQARFPAINILKSVSRTMPDCNSETDQNLIKRARQLLSTYENMAEMIRLGAYKKGSDPLVDEAIHYMPALNEFLAQGKKEKWTFSEGFQKLNTLLSHAL